MGFNVFGITPMKALVFAGMNLLGWLTTAAMFAAMAGLRYTLLK
jgi:hypothetical protein